MQIDIYAHIVPKKCMDMIYEHASNKKVPMLEATPTLTNLEDRFRIMDRFDDLMQVLVPSGEPLELILEPKVAAEFATIYNDELAELMLKYPDRFPAAVAILPLSDIEVTLQELDRAINELRFRGIFLQTPVYSRSEDNSLVTKALDSPEFIPLYERMVKYNLPIWLHPYRVQGVPEYSSESKSRYQIWHVFGWPYDTTAAMTRLVFSGILEKYPSLKVITHHAGGMVPFFEQRIAGGYGFNEMRIGRRRRRVELTKSPLEYFRMFYADTAISGSTPGLMCAHAFFGARRLLFGTDTPYDVQIGYRSVKRTIESIERMDIPPEDKEAIFEGNARELLRLPI
jgi:predicted TIM-barrel fold metal-dependent hydrolase